MRCALWVVAPAVAVTLVLAGCSGDDDGNWRTNPALAGDWILVAVTDDDVPVSANVGPTVLEVEAATFRRMEWALNNYADGTIMTCGQQARITVTQVHASEVTTASHWASGVTIAEYSVVEDVLNLAYELDGKTRREHYQMALPSIPEALRGSWVVTRKTVDGTLETLDETYTAVVGDDGELTIAAQPSGQTATGDLMVTAYGRACVVITNSTIPELNSGTITTGVWMLSGIVTFGAHMDGHDVTVDLDRPA